MTARVFNEPSSFQLRRHQRRIYLKHAGFIQIKKGDNTTSKGFCFCVYSSTVFGSLIIWWLEVVKTCFSHFLLTNAFSEKYISLNQQFVRPANSPPVRDGAYSLRLTKCFFSPFMSRNLTNKKKIRQHVHPQKPQFKTQDRQLILAFDKSQQKQ